MLRKIIRNNKTVFSNTFYLTLIQVIALLVPVVALPYVISVIGKELYGQIVFTQSIAIFFFLIVNFGLDISAVKDVAQNRNNPDRLSEIVSTVYSLKGLLFLLSGICYGIMVIAIPSFHEQALLFFIVYMGAVGEVLFPTWFFQGLERMAMITVVRFIAIAFYFSTVFFVVKKADDYIYVPLLQVTGTILSGIVGFILVLRKYHVRLLLPPQKVLILSFRESAPFFMSRISYTANSHIAKIISGISLGMNEVTIFDIAKKIIDVAFLPLSMLNQAVYPHNAGLQDRRYAAKFMWVIAGAGLVVITTVYLLAPFGVRYFIGEAMPEAITIVRCLCLYIFFGAFSNYTGAPVLVAFGHPKPFNVSCYLSTAVLLCIYGVLYITDTFSLINFAMALVISELVILAYRLYFCFRYKTFSVHGQPTPTV